MIIYADYDNDYNFDYDAKSDGDYNFDFGVASDNQDNHSVDYGCCGCSNKEMFRLRTDPYILHR